MTAHVNSLIDRARPATEESPPATQPARELRAFLDALGKLGYDVPELVRAARLSPADLKDPDALIPLSATGAVFQRAQAVRPLKNIALRMALETPLGAFPLLDYLVVTSDTVGEGVRQLARYFRIVGAPVSIEIRDRENPVRVLMRPDCLDASMTVEYVASIAVHHLRRETGGRLEVAYVSLELGPEDPADFEERLGCPVRAEASWSGIALPRSSWKLALQRRDPILRGVLETQANQVVAKLPRSRKPADEIRRVLASRVAGGDTRIQTVARQLAMSVRTLQRRLAAEKLSYQDVLEEIRRQAAERYLSDATLSAAEVGFLLGYSEPAAFHRAFKRWHGMTPVQFRKKG
jgi:AraC-like DNA-binding protein